MPDKEFQRGIRSAQMECERLREENNRPRKLLSEHSIPIPAIQIQGPTLVQGAETAIDSVNHTSDSKAKIARFRSLFRGREDVYAVRWENNKLAIVPKIRLHKEPGARTGFLDVPKFEELLGALPSYLRPLIAMLYWSGVRKGEALSIDWAQADLQRREIRLDDEQTKSGEARVRPLHPEVLAWLEHKEPKHGPVFDATNLRTEWETACAAVGLGKRVKVEGPVYNWHKYTGLRLHDMRRSAVRNMRVLGNVPETVAMKISGHKTRHVFDRYNIVTTGDLHAAMQAVAVGAAKVLPAVANGNGSRAKSKGKLSVRRAVLTGRTRSKPA